VWPCARPTLRRGTAAAWLTQAQRTRAQQGVPAAECPTTWKATTPTVIGRGASTVEHAQWPCRDPRRGDRGHGATRPKPVPRTQFKAPTRTKLVRLRPNQLDRAQEGTTGHHEEPQMEPEKDNRERYRYAKIGSSSSVPARELSPRQGQQHVLFSY
jgi:hypothetical protein